MKKLFIVVLLFISSLSLFSKSMVELNPDYMEENIYIVEDQLNILLSKKEAEIYIEKAFSYLLQFNDLYADILRKKMEYSVQLFTRKDGDKRIVYLNFFILQEKKDSFNTVEVVVFDGGTDFWNITYDLEKEDFCDLWINGEA